jgi:site-specific DNA-methyltransferase (adenine-specific)
MNYIYFQDNLKVLKRLPGDSIDLIYIDPPFNTGKKQERTRIQVKKSIHGDRKGFGGFTYKTSTIVTRGYDDCFGDKFLDFLEERIKLAYKVLANHGTLYFHIDYRESHRCRLLLDKIFGRGCFLHEIIWAYDYGGRSKTKWPTKHDNILVYVKNPYKYTFNIKSKPSRKSDERNNYWRSFEMDCWWHTIVPTNGKEREGYPTQKPLGIIKPIIEISSNPGDKVLDFFAGSGTVGDACLQLGRRFILVDNNKQAIEVMRHRFSREKMIRYIGI